MCRVTFRSNFEQKFYFHCLQICFIGIAFDTEMVHGCHTDKVYLQPIKEIKFLDDWKEQYENITEGIFSIQSNIKYV